MNIALIWPESTFLIDPMVYPPLGLWYIWSMLSDEGHQVAYYDMSDPLLNKQAIPWRSYNQVWISGTTPQLYRIEYWTAFSLNKGIKTVVGGPHVTAFTDTFARQHPQVVVFKGEVCPGDVKRVVEAHPGDVVVGLTRPALGRHPLPNRTVARRYVATLGGRACTTMMTSIGCPFNCAFCSSPSLYGRTVRYFPLMHVYKDLDVCKRLGFGAIQFYDDILPIKPNRTLSIAYELHKENFLWRCFMRSDVGTRNGKEFLMELANKGLTEILVGVESADNGVKDRVGKGTTIDQDTQLRDWCREAGISFKASFVLGLPGETRATMEATRQWILNNRPDRADVNVLIPMPGTPIYDEPAKYGCSLCNGHSRISTYFYKGRLSEVKAVASTSGLTAEQITEFRLRLLSELKREGIPY